MSDHTLTGKQKLFFIVFIIISAIYSIVVGLLLVYSTIATSTKLTIMIGYTFIAPTIIYLMWFNFCRLKLKKYPIELNILGGNLTFLFLFFLMGFCVVTWAAYWNSGIDSFWLGGAILVYMLTNNDLITTIYYYTGSSAVTPALVEEFLKSFPSIIAFFVVLQRRRNPQQKGKGIAGNELIGMLIGVMVGIAFEILELSIYVIRVIYADGTLMDVFFQVTVRDWAPIHVLGGGMGGYAAGRADRLRFENGEENLPMGVQAKNFLKRFLPFWFIPVTMHFLWNGTLTWIALYFIITNNNNELQYLIAEMTVIVTLTIVCICLLIIFFKRATKAAEKTYRCPETGAFVLVENTICEPIADSISAQYKIQHQITPGVRYCFNCATPVPLEHRFCTTCGADLIQVDYMDSMHRYRLYKPVKRFLVVSMLYGILFAIFTLFLLYLTLTQIGIKAFFLLGLDTSLGMLSSCIIVSSAWILIKINKNFSGKVNVWTWIFQIFNYVGLMLMLLFFGPALIIEATIVYLADTSAGIPFGIYLGIFLTVNGGIMFIFFIYFFKKHGGHFLLHYQQLD